ncbi:hypothetical protein BB561_001564 [Smittium simulii]|uniref:ATP-dependent RNA helicase DRS1 n=1 Tax=Smittium simulii TaxID=133385 RepID=A0A2T9YUA5_9FUNG|nr:hypothetical protein BB561_001564 [Smittium simulii]
MKKASDLVMTIGDDEDFTVEETIEETEELHTTSSSSKKKKSKQQDIKVGIDTNFKIDLELDGLETIPMTMDFTLAKNNLARKNGATNKRTIDEIIAQKRKDVKKSKKKCNILNKIAPEDTIVEENTKSDEAKNSESENSQNEKSQDSQSSDSDSEESSDENSDSEDSDSEADSDDSSSSKNSKKSKFSTTRLKSKNNLKKQDEDSESEIDETEEQRRKEYFAQDEDMKDMINLNSNEPLSFTSMNISRPIMRGLSSLGFVQPTPIQAKTIPVGLMGKDICGSAVTGSGKTAAFLVPILERLLFRPTQVALSRVLILAPTRELAMQCHNVATKIAAFTDIRICLAVGGLSVKMQESELRERPDIVIATPGRLIDHVRNSASFTLDHIEVLIMDEADRMLEDGFKEELTEIIQHCPKKRQTMLFSATMTDNINDLIRLSLNKPIRIMVDPPKQTSTRLIQEFVRVRMGKEQSRVTFLVVLCKFLYKKKVIIFFRSKAAAHQFKIMFGLLGMKSGELHGSMPQEARMLALEEFRDGKIEFLMATDLASRGLDIKGIQTVINYNMPQTFDLYLHRVGRTARAGRSGRAVTLVGEEDRKMLKMAIKSANKKGKSLVKQRVLDPQICEKYKVKVAELQIAVDEVLEIEKQESKLQQVERDLNRAENLIRHEKEIHSKPKRTWFISQKQKADSKKRANSEYLEKIGI